MAKTSGRQIEIGVGIESTPGTPVAATDYVKWESMSIQSMADKLSLTSARGIRNKSSNSIINRKYGKGDIEFVPTVDIMPYFLSLFLGSRTTTMRSGESAVYDHVFSVQNANASMKTATLLVKQGGVQTERYANVVADTFDLTVDTDFAKCKIGVLCAFPDTGSISPSYTQDTLFSRNRMTATFGSSLTNAVGTFASTTLTSDATNVADGATVTIDTTTYTFKTALTNSGNTPYEILIGADAAHSLDNLKAAVNNTGTAGTTYGAGTLAHKSVVATTNTDTTQLIQAIVSGTAANSIVTTAVSAHLSWAGATMNSGTPGTGAVSTPLVNFALSGKNNITVENAFLSFSNQIVSGGLIAGPFEMTGSYTLQFSDTADLIKYQQNTKSALVVSLIGDRIGVVPSQEAILFKHGRIVLNDAPLEYKLDDLTFIKQKFTVEYDATDKEFSATVTNTADGTNY